MKPLLVFLLTLLPLGIAQSAEPLPLSPGYWKDPAFLASFNGSYRIEARIEPTLSSEERGLLVRIQKEMAAENRNAALKILRDSPLTANSAALQFNLGNLHFEEGDLAAAEKAYLEAIEKYPSFRRAHRNLAMVHAHNGDMEKALEPLLEAIRLGDQDGATLGLLGYARLQRGEWASALQAYQLARLTEPEAVDWQAGIAQALREVGRPEEAVALLEEVVAQRPEEPSFALLLADLQLSLDRDEEALVALDFLRRTDRLSPDAAFLLATLHLRAGDLDRATAVAKEALTDERQPGANAAINLLESAAAAKAWELADALAAVKFEELSPAAAQRRELVLARVDLGRGETEAAEKRLQGIVEADPTAATALRLLAGIRRDAGQTEEAAMLLERAIRSEPESIAPRLDLAKLQVETGRYSTAVKTLEELTGLTDDPHIVDYLTAVQAVADAAQ